MKQDEIKEKKDRKALLSSTYYLKRKKTILFPSFG